MGESASWLMAISHLTQIQPTTASELSQIMEAAHKEELLIRI